MPEQIEAFVFTSTEIQELIIDNELNLVELLQKEGCQVEQGSAADPIMSDTDSTKEIATTILASAALVGTLTPIILKIIQSLTYKNVVVHETVLIPVEDSAGNILKDASGEPILQWVRQAKILESQAQKVKQEVSIKALGFEIEIKSSDI